MQQYQGSVKHRAKARSAYGHQAQYGGEAAHEESGWVTRIPGITTAKRINRSVHANPWLHIGVVTAFYLSVGFFLGLFLGRKSSTEELS